jgi:hypothetical protein
MNTVRMNTLALPTNAVLESSSTSSTSKTELSSLLPGKPELQCALAVYNYHAKDDRGFNFNIGDTISVREYCCRDWWLGVNVTTNSIGIFPPSHVLWKSETTGMENDGASVDREIQTAIIDTQEDLHAVLLKEFNQQFSPQTEPKAAFDIIRNLHKVDSNDFWLCFCLAYPKAALSAAKLREQLQLVDDLCFRKRPGRVDLITCKASMWQWSSFINQFYPEYNRQWTRWNDVKEQVRSSIASSVASWAAFRHEILNIKEPITKFEGMVDRLDGLISLLQSQLTRMEERVIESLQRDADGMSFPTPDQLLRFDILQWYDKRNADYGQKRKT